MKRLHTLQALGALSLIAVLAGFFVTCEDGYKPNVRDIRFYQEEVKKKNLVNDTDNPLKVYTNKATNLIIKCTIPSGVSELSIDVQYPKDLDVTPGFANVDDANIIAWDPGHIKVDPLDASSDLILQVKYKPNSNFTTGTITVTIRTTGGDKDVAADCRVDFGGGPPPIDVTFNSVTPNGSSIAKTTSLTLSFSQAIPGLVAGDITLTGVPLVNRGALSAPSGSAPTVTYTLSINGSFSNGDLTVDVAKSGYTITPASKTVAIYGTPPSNINVTFSNLTVNNTTTTTELTLTFSGTNLSGLNLSGSNISFSGVNGVTVNGTITGSGTTTYTVPISGFTEGGNLTVTLTSPSGYNITPTFKTVVIYAGTVATPTADPVAGTYTGTQSVTLATTTTGATIRYTIDGTTPTATTGTVFTTGTPISVATTTTIRAIAYKTGMADSGELSAGYTISIPGTYGITLSPNNVPDDPYIITTSPLTVTVSNPTGNQATGALSIALSGANSSSFDLSASSLASIAAGANATFDVSPKAGLAAGNHDATITVSGGNGISATLKVRFTVAATGSINITFEITDASPTIGPIPTLSKSGTPGGTPNSKVTLTATGTFASITWSVDNVEKGTSASFDLDADDYLAGPHSLTVVWTLTTGGAPYNRTVYFLVED